MGVQSFELDFFLSGLNDGLSIERSLLLGQQTLYVEPEPLRRQLAAHGVLPRDFDPDRLRADGDDHPDPLGLGPGRRFFAKLLAMLGARWVDVLDASDYDGAGLIHDLNEPIPDDWKGCYDLVYDGGTIEHVFNFPIALRNCMEMVRPGGCLLLMTPANNYFGHGFYQVSPCLYYQTLSEENGFHVERHAGFGGWSEEPLLRGRRPAPGRRSRGAGQRPARPPLRPGLPEGGPPDLPSFALPERLRVVVEPDASRRG